MVFFKPYFLVKISVNKKCNNSCGIKNAILQDPLFCRFNLKPYIPRRGKIEEKTAQLCKTFNGRKCSGDLSLYFLAQFKLNVYKLRKMLKCEEKKKCEYFHSLLHRHRRCGWKKRKRCWWFLCQKGLFWNKILAGLIHTSKIKKKWRFLSVGPKTLANKSIHHENYWKMPFIPDLDNANGWI